MEIWLQVLPNGLCWWALHITEVKKSLNQRAHSFRVQLCLFPFVGRKTRQKLYFVCAKWTRHCEFVVTWALSLRSLAKIGIRKKGTPITIITVILNSLQIQFIWELRTSANLSVAASGSSSWSCLNTGMHSYRKIWRKILNWFNRRTRKWSFTLPNHLSFCKRLW